MNQNKKIRTCEMCGRIRELTFHHLIPRTCHTNKWFRKNFSREDMKQRGMNICPNCHDFIHKTYDEKELGRYINTLEKLMKEPKTSNFVKWIKKQK